MDEVFFPINGKRHDLWRAVDQNENVLDILVDKTLTTYFSRFPLGRIFGMINLHIFSLIFL